MFRKSIPFFKFFAASKSFFPQIIPHFHCCTCSRAGSGANLLRKKSDKACQVLFLPQFHTPCTNSPQEKKCRKCQTLSKNIMSTVLYMPMPCGVFPEAVEKPVEIVEKYWFSTAISPFLSPAPVLVSVHIRMHNRVFMFRLRKLCCRGVPVNSAKTMAKKFLFPPNLYFLSADFSVIAPKVW